MERRSYGQNNVHSPIRNLAGNAAPGCPKMKAYNSCFALFGMAIQSAPTSISATVPIGQLAATNDKQ